jgi:DNA-binding transcriptional LysR family regulator
MNQVEVIRDGTVDVGYLQLPVDERGLEIEPLFSEPRVAVLSTDHRLAGEPGSPSATTPPPPPPSATSTTSSPAWPTGRPLPCPPE